MYTHIYVYTLYVSMLTHTHIRRILLHGNFDEYDRLRKGPSSFGEIIIVIIIIVIMILVMILLVIVIMKVLVTTVVMIIAATRSESGSAAVFLLEIPMRGFVSQTSSFE